ncbi:hypothetical protein OIU84_029512 [Salix udensis]|uniref:Uncharacterized protein n=1 Tax=Salix udensis TaxID=889485 RepID=A0AAD6KB10_9ROSI|nr:hypothetical protein OIU84_029512 [Salix udensis]
MAGANFLERAMDAEEWGDDDLALPPRHLPVEEVRDYKCGFPVTYISFPCHPLEDCCDGGDDDSDKITNHSRPGSEGKLVKRRSKLSSSIIVIVKAITMLLIIAGMDI